MHQPFATTWIAVDDILEPDLGAAPAATEGMMYIGFSSYVPPGHTPEVGDPVVVYLAYAPLPEPPASDEPPAEPTD